MENFVILFAFCIIIYVYVIEPGSFIGFKAKSNPLRCCFFVGDGDRTGLSALLAPIRQPGMMVPILAFKGRSAVQDR